MNNEETGLQTFIKNTCLTLSPIVIWIILIISTTILMTIFRKPEWDTDSYDIFFLLATCIAYGLNFLLTKKTLSP